MIKNSPENKSINIKTENKLSKKQKKKIMKLFKPKNNDEKIQMALRGDYRL